jgi:signal transduction protein with GAF and PtsI domain
VPATGADAWFGSVGGALESPPEPSKPPQVADLLEQVVTSGGRLVGASDVLVYLVERDTRGGQRLIVRRGAGCFATSIGRSVGKGEGLAGEVWRIGSPLAVEEDQTWPARLGGNGGEDRIYGELAVPLHSHGVVVGCSAWPRVGRAGSSARPRWSCCAASGR